MILPELSGDFLKVQFFFSPVALGARIRKELLRGKYYGNRKEYCKFNNLNSFSYAIVY